jgi:cation transport regulator ChaC
LSAAWQPLPAHWDDYLFRTCEGLRGHGIRDQDLEQLRAEVAAALAAQEA